MRYRREHIDVCTLPRAWTGIRSGFRSGRAEELFRAGRHKASESIVRARHVARADTGHQDLRGSDYCNIIHAHTSKIHAVE